MKLAGLQLSFSISHPVKKKICSLPPDSGNNMSTLQSTFFFLTKKFLFRKCGIPLSMIFGATQRSFDYSFINLSLFLKIHWERTWSLYVSKGHYTGMEYPTIAPTNGHRYPVPSPEIQHADTNTQLTNTLDQFTDSRLWYWNREIN